MAVCNAAVCIWWRMWLFVRIKCGLSSIKFTFTIYIRMYFAHSSYMFLCAVHHLKESYSVYAVQSPPPQKNT